MKFIKNIVPLFLVLTVCSCSSFSFKNFVLNIGHDVYIVGVSASFTDSLVYFTEMQMLDSVRLDANGLLPNRVDYSYQLKSYLEEEEGLTNRTCFVYFSENKVELQSEITKMKAKYQQGQTLVLREVNPNTFRFRKPEY